MAPDLDGVLGGQPGGAPGGGVIGDEIVLLTTEEGPSPEPEPEPTPPPATTIAHTVAAPVSGWWLSAAAYLLETTRTAGDDLDLVQARLHDDGVLWTRAELLRLYNDGYRQLCAISGAVRRWRPLDLPGRHTYAITQEWESASAYRGIIRKVTHASLSERYQGTNMWESEGIEGLDPTTTLDGHTQEWERAYRDGASDHHYRFTFPRNHERVIRMHWQDRKLFPVDVRALDDTGSQWWAQLGQPRWWTTGTGRVRSVELFEIATDYNQAYALPERIEGIARQFSGERTWGVDVPYETPNDFAYTSSADLPSTLGFGIRMTLNAVTGIDPIVVTDIHPIHQWEADLINGETALTDSTTIGGFTWEHQFGTDRLVPPIGQPRHLTSPQRQYLPLLSDTTMGSLLGHIVDWRSSEDSVFALEVVVPDGDLVEEDTPTLIPPQMMKYLRFYVISRAFGRPGEGRQPILADFYGRRFQRGVDLFRSFGNVARNDQVFQREAIEPTSRRPAYVRLPATFPNPWD